MTSKEKRLEEIIRALSPEEKARLAIEDTVRKEPALSPGDRLKMVRALSSQEWDRYHAVITRYQVLLPNLRLLAQLVDEARRQLLERDRILWFERALVEMEEAIVFDPAVANALLVKNPNLKPGEPLEIRAFLGTVRLGVWGKKKRSPIGKTSGVQLDERIVEVLGLLVGRVRRLAGEVKAIYGYLIEESRRICVEVYDAIVHLKPEWHHPDDDSKGTLKVVMTGSASDRLPWQPHIRNKARREALAKRFRDPNDPLKAVIVRDMWLTGFNAPSLHTMYVDKPMRGHGLHASHSSREPRIPR